MHMITTQTVIQRNGAYIALADSFTAHTIEDF